MLFRIDFERFLTHAIDHFTRDELTHFQYAIIGTVINGGRCKNIVKLNDLFPDMETQQTFIEYGDKSILKKMYFDYLSDKGNLIYHTFINTFLNHQDVMILCKEGENAYIDVLVEYLKKNYSVECIDLNELFTKGRVGSIYIDRDEIHDKAVDVRRAAVKDQLESLASTSEGRLKILTEYMDTKGKIKKLKDLGINVTKADLKDLDKLLIEAWVEKEDDD